MSTSCTHCHTEIADGARFCLHCGTPVASASSDNIALSDTGGIARPPSAPEPNSAWQPEPPAAPAATPAPDGPPPAGPTPSQPPYFNPDGSHPEPAAFTDAEEASSGGGPKLAAMGLGVIGVLLIGFIAFRFIAGGDGVSGGASSPEAVVDEMVAAINAEDPLALVNLMAPDELDGFDDLVSDTTELYNELGLSEVLGDDLEERDFEVDIEIDVDDVDVSMEGDNAAIVSFELEGEIETQGEDNFGMLESERDTFDASDLEDALPNGSDAVEMIVVKIDGKWFASPMLTMGHYIVENADLPPGDYDLVGSDDRDDGGNSPVEAVEQFVEAINDRDADALAGSLGGGEGRVMLVFNDAIDEVLEDLDEELDRDGVRFEVSVQTEDIGDGRVRLDEIEIEAEDNFDEVTISVEDDCATVREDGRRTSDGCLLDELNLDDEDIDTTLWVDTVTENGSHRVRLIPTFTDVMRRFVNVVDDRQTALLVAELPYVDNPVDIDVNTDIDIEFDGQLYTVHEFEIQGGEQYYVQATGETQVALWVDDGFGFNQQYSRQFEAFDDGLVRVVTYSDLDTDDEYCDPSLACLPTGEGETTLRIREGARQSVPFPSVLSGELGPSGIRVFELEVAQSEVVEIEVGPDSGVRWNIEDDFDIRLEFGVYEFTPGTYELVIYNSDPESSVEYTITPMAR